MVEVKCSRIQYNVLIDALAGAQLRNGKCFLRKDEYSCLSILGKYKSCEDCLKSHIMRIDKKGTTNGKTNEVN